MNAAGATRARGVRRTAPAAATAVALALGGCTLITDSFLTNEFSGDKFPVHVDASRGAILVGVRPVASGASTDHLAVFDLLSPFTLIDPGIDTAPSLRYADVLLLGKPTSTGSLMTPRARFPEVQLLSLHPCTRPGSGSTLSACQIGAGSEVSTFDAVLGADALAGDALRLHLPPRTASDPVPDDQLFVLADIGGSDRQRTFACDAVFGSPYRGGGTLLISGTELPFGNRRITIQTCLGQDEEPIATADFDTNPTPFRQHGADALFVVSTSIGISILGRAAYERYIAAVAGDLASPPLAFDQLPADSVYLPSGQITGGRATINRLALVGASSANSLSPCRQLYAHRLLSSYAPSEKACLRNDKGLSPRDCPCKSGDTFCLVPAIVQVLPTAGDVIDVLVVADTEPTLQALRTELRPDQPEVDGILGTDVLRGLELDVDYPHDRLLARCAGPACLVRPALEESGDVCQINRCTTGAAQPLGCGDNLRYRLLAPDEQ